MNLRIGFFVALVGLGMVGCRPSEPPSPVAGRGVNSPPLTTKVGPPEPWAVVSLDPNGAPAWIGNSLIGFRVAADGSDADPEDYPALRIDHVQPDGEEKILPWNDQRALMHLIAPDLPAMTGYSRRLDFGTGRLTTTYDRGSLHVEIRQAVHPDRAELAEEWILRAVQPTPIRLQAGALAVPGRTALSIDEPPSHAKETRRSDGIREWELTVGPDGTSVGRSVQWEIPGRTALASPPSPDTAFREYETIWRRRWSSDIIIDGPVEDQQAVRSFLFYLRQATLPAGKRSVSPMGLSRTQYFGHVFWDADLWVFPALALLEPDAARSIAAYRVRMAPAARANLAAALRKPEATFLPNALPAIRANATTYGADALMYPWESAVSGRETVPGPSRNQHHITGTVAFALDHAADLGLVARADADRIGRGAAAFYLLRSELRPDGRRAIRGTMSPDENFTGDNDLYTNALAQILVDRHRPEVQAKFVLPRDAKGFISYEGDRFRGYKQAAAVLSIYPLQFPPAEAEAKMMMERFAGSVIANGPAMTDSIHALIEARLGQPDAGYATWRQSWRDFTGHPLLLFSEKRRRDVTYFVTGAAGCLQTTLFGFGGFRIDDHAPGDPQVFRVPLQDGAWLTVKPSLPTAWKSVQFTGVHVLGRRLNITATRNGAVATGD